MSVDLAVIAANLLAGAGMVALLGVLTWVSWGVVRSGATTQHHVMQAARQRLVPALWVVLSVFVATSMYGEANNSSWELPNAWEVATADNRAYALLALGAYLFVVQVLLGLVALTKGPNGAFAGRAPTRPRRESQSDLGAALTSTLSLVAMLFALIAMTVVGYLQVLAFT